MLITTSGFSKSPGIKRWTGLPTIRTSSIQTASMGEPMLRLWLEATAIVAVVAIRLHLQRLGRKRERQARRQERQPKVVQTLITLLRLQKKESHRRWLYLDKQTRARIRCSPYSACTCFRLVQHVRISSASMRLLASLCRSPRSNRRTWLTRLLCSRSLK